MSEAAEIAFAEYGNSRGQELGMTRGDCEAWLAGHNLPVPPKSSCTFCPFHSRKAWSALGEAGGPDWEQALAVDAEIRGKRPPHALFVHPARIPLAEAVALNHAVPFVQAGLFDPEGRCDEGVCWV